MVSSPDWMSVRARFATILYGRTPMVERLDALQLEIQALKCSHDLRGELESMAHSASGNREAPFLDVGRHLLTYCVTRHCHELQSRGEDYKGFLGSLEHDEERMEQEQQNNEELEGESEE